MRAGEVFYCWRPSCPTPNKPINPRLWDLGHVDPELRHLFGTRWPEHRACNRRTVTHLKEQLEPDRDPFEEVVTVDAAQLRECADDGCSNVFVPNRQGWPRLYCAGCSTKTAYSRRWRKGETHSGPPRPPRVRVLPREAVCRGCGETYMQTVPGERYCTQECRPPTGAKVTAICEGCGQEFEARARDRERGWGRWCGKACFRRQRIKEHPLPRPSPEALIRSRDPQTGRFLAAA
jgi:hypothetical protein